MDKKLPRFNIRNTPYSANRLLLEKVSLNSLVQMRPPELVLIHNEHGTVLAKREVRSTILDQDLAEQDTTSRPDIDTVPAASIDVTFHVDLDTIGNSITWHGKDTTVGQERFPIDLGHVERVARRVGKSFSKGNIKPESTYIVAANILSVEPSPLVSAVSVIYTVFSSGEKVIPFGLPKPSAIARTFLVAGSYRYTWFGS